MPLMSESLLDWPLLSKQYFLLINSMVSNYTPRVACLDHAFFAQLLDSVLFGIKVVADCTTRTHPPPCWHTHPPTSKAFTHSFTHGTRSSPPVPCWC